MVIGFIGAGLFSGWLFYFISIDFPEYIINENNFEITDPVFTFA